MSIKNWPGGRISPTPPTPSGPFQNSTASGVWTLDQVAYWEQQNQWPTAGNVNQNLFIENLFQTWLYTGNGATQTITNGINLSGQGGLLWMKSRSQVAGHMLYDTVSNTTLRSDTTGFNSGYYPTYINPTSSGFFLDAAAGGGFNTNAVTYASWTFRRQAKFFDVVTYTGNGTTNGTQVISHNLGSTPGCIIIKRTDSASDWFVYHRGTPGGGIPSGANSVIRLNSNSTSTSITFTSWGVTSTTFTPFSISGSPDANVNGGTYVAYLFAHNAGGFGPTGTDNVISCGSYSPTAGASSTFIDLGWEPQWVLIKNTNISGNPYTGWGIFDNMRGVTTPGDDQFLLANSSDAESNGVPLSIPSYVDFNATGFTANTTTLTGANGGGHTYIYIAIRRGPMQTPTTGTSVYQGTTRTGTGAAASISGLSFPPDMVITRNRISNGSSRYAAYDKLRGATIYLDTATTDAEFTVAQSLTSFNQTGESFGTGSISNFNGDPYINWQFRRAPGFFDVVCYTGTGSATTQAHNLGVVPEMMIVKVRNDGGNWITYSASLGNTKYLRIASDVAAITDPVWNNTTPTATVFSIGAGAPTNQNTFNYVAYLFATVSGVSKVGSYTGTGALQTIDCGFTGGARWVMIKRTDSTGDWYVWDSARGISSGNDPYLLLNSNAAEVTGTNYVDTTSVGFQVTAASPAGLNASGGSYIFLAIA